MWAKRAVVVILLLLVVGGAAFFALSWRSEIAAVEPPARSAFEPALLTRGAQLAALGNCNACHTVPGGPRFAGGLGVPTPFGTIYSTNITPDRDTGIGRWSEEAFRRSMREGVSRDGHHLYPAFPYDHFTKITDEDDRALYAFLMTREPVRNQAPANKLPFPLSFRPILAGWNLLFFRSGAYQPDQGQSTEWNRGAYLAEGVAHCSACHSPRNAFGAEKRDQYMAGGGAEGWHAPALNAQSPAPVPWTADSLYAYLRQGWDEHHGSPAGPMLPVVRNMAPIAEADVRAIAVYTASTIGQPSAERKQKADELVARVSRAEASASGIDSTKPQGDHAAAALFTGACATCHSEARPQGESGAVHLAFSSALNLPEPTNVIRVLLEGIQPSEGERGPFMPSFATTLTDAQMADLVAYLRAQFTSAPPWNDVPGAIRQIREGRDHS